MSEFKTSQMQTPFEKYGSKVILRSHGLSIQNTSQKLHKGEHLVAVVNTACEKQENNLKLQSRAFVLDSDMSQAELSDLVESDPCILGVSLNTTFHTTMTPNDPQFKNLTHLTAIHATAAYNTFYDSSRGATSDVVVAIIDTGVDLTHADLTANRWINTAEIPGNKKDDDENGYIDDINGYNFASNTGNSGPQVWTDDPGGEMHATHVAGLIAGVANNGVGVAGVMGTHARIMSLNIFGATSDADVTSVDNAIYYATDNGAKVINMSLSACTDSPSTEVAVAYAISKGVTVVAAAGNNGQELTSNLAEAVECTETGKIFVTPASYAQNRPGLITVGSVDATTGGFSRFSNYSKALVKIAAPGSDSSTEVDSQTGSAGLLSTLPGNKYGLMEGTSMASPIVAGAAALAISLAKSRFNRVLLPNVVEDILVRSATVQAILKPAIKGGGTLDLESLATKILENDFIEAPECF